MSGISTVYSTDGSVANKTKDQVPHHWPFWGEITGHLWILHKKATFAENIAIQWRARNGK